MTQEEQDLLNYLQTSPFYATSNLEKEYTREEFLSEFNSLSPVLQSLLTTGTTSDFVRSLGHDHSLDASQTALVALMIRYTVMAKVYIKNIPNILEQVLGLQEESAMSIYKKIVDELFRPVWEDIKKLQVQKFGGQVVQSAPVTSPPPQKMNYPGEELPETGGNIIDLRNSK